MTESPPGMDGVLERIFEDADDGIAIATVDDEILRYVNPALARMLGYDDPAQLIGETIAILHPPADLAAVQEVFRAQALRIRNIAANIPCAHVDGSVLHCDVHAGPIAVGGTRHTLGIFVPVERREPSVTALVEAEERFQQLFNTMADGVAIYEPIDDGADFVFVDINPAGEALSQVDRKEIIGRRLTEVFPGAESMGLLEALQRVLRSGEPETLPLSLYTDDRIEQFVENHILRLPAGLLVAIYEDTSKERRAKEALRRSEQHFRELIDASPIAIAVLDRDRRITSLNRRFIAKFGYTKADIPTLDRWWERAYPDPAYRAEVQQIWSGAEQRAAEQGGDIAAAGEASITCKDGSVRQVEVVGSRIGEQQVVTLRDRTKQVAAEQALREREEQLRLAQKMEAVGRLAGGVAHDFNNLLTGIIGNVALARMDLAEDDPLLPILDEIKIVSGRTSALVKQLLAFSRGELLRPRPLDLAELLESTGKMLEGLLGEDIEFAMELAPQLRPILADRTQVEQVIVNLSVNARDAMPRGGRLRIETESCAFDRTRAASMSLMPGDYVCLSVADTGEGMDAQTREHIFEPFFTTKSSQRGSGLGLATVYAIVERHAGRIEVSSEPERGTTFRIYLPLLSSGIALTVESVEATTEQPARGGDETILLVEDEPLVRNMAARALELRGYRVHATPHGEAALELLAELAEPPALLITDVVMPAMNGRELAERVRQIHPSLPVLFISGYSAAVLDRYGSLPETDGEQMLLAKPFEPDELARCARSLLDGRATS